MGETFFYFEMDHKIALDQGSGGSCSQFNLLSLTSLKHVTLWPTPFFFKTSPFDLHDVIEKSGVMEWKDNGLWSLANMDLNPDSTYQFCGLTKLLNLSKLQCSVFKKESHITT